MRCTATKSYWKQRLSYVRFRLNDCRYFHSSPILSNLDVATALQVKSRRCFNAIFSWTCRTDCAAVERRTRNVKKRSHAPSVRRVAISNFRTISIVRTRYKYLRFYRARRHPHVSGSSKKYNKKKQTRRKTNKKKNKRFGTDCSGCPRSPCP